jgi:hypothetical protein
VLERATAIVAICFSGNSSAAHRVPITGTTPGELGLQDFGLSIQLAKASDLAPNSCGMSTFDLKSLVGEIDVLRSDE